MEKENLIKHIGKHENNPLMVKVLTQDTTFQTEVEDFYDMSYKWICLPRVLPYRDFKIKKGNLEQKNKSPANLVNLLNEFNEEQLGINKLSYDSVREDYQRWNSKLRLLKRSVVLEGGIIGGSVGIASCILSLIMGRADIAIPSGIVGIGVAGGSCKAMVDDYPIPKGTNYEFSEYLNLLDIAENTDSFIKEDYVKYMANKYLNTK